jgi:hypothetical protein
MSPYRECRRSPSRVPWAVGCSHRCEDRKACVPFPSGLSGGTSRESDHERVFEGSLSATRPSRPDRVDGLPTRRIRTDIGLGADCFLMTSSLRCRHGITTEKRSWVLTPMSAPTKNGPRSGRAAENSPPRPSGSSVADTKSPATRRRNFGADQAQTAARTRQRSPTAVSDRSHSCLGSTSVRSSSRSRTAASATKRRRCA